MRASGLADGPARAAAYTAVLLLALWAAKLLAGLLNGLGAWASAGGELILGAVIAAEVILPARRCDAHGLSLAAIGLDLRHWRRDLIGAAQALAWALPLYVVGTCAWLQRTQPATAAWSASDRSGAWAISAGAAATALFDGLTLPACGRGLWHITEQVVGVALPEEVFFRGYLLPQLWRRWPSHSAWQALFGPAAWLAAMAFGLAHWLGEWQPQRLLPLFPSLLFGQLAWRQRSVIGAIAAHAGCNLAAQLVWTFFVRLGALKASAPM